jgi:hypothetical protein
MVALFVASNGDIHGGNGPARCGTPRPDPAQFGAVRRSLHRIWQRKPMQKLTYSYICCDFARETLGQSLYVAGRPAWQSLTGSRHSLCGLLPTPASNMRNFHPRRRFNQYYRRSATATRHCAWHPERQSAKGSDRCFAARRAFKFTLSRRLRTASCNAAD